jgi:hypothetical protein
MRLPMNLDDILHATIWDDVYVPLNVRSKLLNVRSESLNLRSKPLNEEFD